MIVCVVFSCADYFAKHMGDYEGVLASLETLNLSILKAMDFTKKVCVCVCVSVCDSVSVIRSELSWLGQGLILHIYLERLGSAARKCIASMNVFPKIQGTTILPHLFRSSGRSRLSGGLIALEDRPQGHFNVVLDSLVSDVTVLRQFQNTASSAGNENAN